MKLQLLFCREAGTFWNEETTDGHINMRARINTELAAVAEELDNGGLAWSLRNVKRLIAPYPPRSDVDRILANLGEDYNHDTIDDLDHAETAVAGNDKEAIDTDSEATTDSENLDKTSSDTARIWIKQARAGTKAMQSH